ncbi:hypothetical protein ACNPQM_07420 [Streptomyces sp. NPDC056231]|uniref:hypothetical protein n=1 Tax=Streptomyces sp. NPDC056231 TaxID=3345755 RepID=UPI003AABF71C
MGLLHRTAAWVVNHGVGPMNLGTLIVGSREHVVAVVEGRPVRVRRHWVLVTASDFTLVSHVKQPASAGLGGFFGRMSE